MGESGAFNVRLTSAVRTYFALNLGYRFGSFFKLRKVEQNNHDNTDQSIIGYNFVVIINK
jgi:hypothetical protein